MITSETCLAVTGSGVLPLVAGAVVLLLLGALALTMRRRSVRGHAGASLTFTALLAVTVMAGTLAVAPPASASQDCGVAEPTPAVASTPHAGPAPAAAPTTAHPSEAPILEPTPTPTTAEPAPTPTTAEPTPTPTPTCPVGTLAFDPEFPWPGSGSFYLTSLDGLVPGTVLTAELSGVATGWVNVEVRYFDAAGEIAYLDYVWEESEPFPWGGVAYSNLTFDPSRGFMQYQPRHVWDTAREAAMAVFDPAPLDAQLLVSVPAKAAETMTANPNLVRYELGVHNTNAFGSYSLAMTFTDPAGCSQTDTIWPGRSID